MILYHGSTYVVTAPNIAFSRDKLDFGKGFYTTPIKEQAQNWAKRFDKMGKPAVLNVYEFDENLFNQLKKLEFYSYNEEWLDFILANRMGNAVNNWDIVIGGVANDRIFNTLELLQENLIDKQTALGRLIYEENNLQICFRNQIIINNNLFFRESMTL